MFRNPGQIFPTTFPILPVSSDSETETSERPYHNIGPSVQDNAEVEGVPQHMLPATSDQTKPSTQGSTNISEISSNQITVDLAVPVNSPNPRFLGKPGSNDRSTSSLSLNPSQSHNQVPFNTPIISPRPSTPDTDHRVEPPLSPLVIRRAPTVINVNSTSGSGLDHKFGLLSSSDDPVSSGSSRKSSVRYPSYLLPTLSVPPFESKVAKLSPVPLALSPYSYSPSSAISLRSLSTRSIVSDVSTIFGPEKEQVLTERMRVIVAAFRNRAKKVKHRLEQPPTPTEVTSDEDEDDKLPVGGRLILDNFADSVYGSKQDLSQDVSQGCNRFLKKFEFIDPRGYINIGSFIHAVTHSILYYSLLIHSQMLGIYSLFLNCLIFVY